jgi:hypothetical protein
MADAVPDARTNPNYDLPVDDLPVDDLPVDDLLVLETPVTVIPLLDQVVQQRRHIEMQSCGRWKPR